MSAPFCIRFIFCNILLSLLIIIIVLTKKWGHKQLTIDFHSFLNTSCLLLLVSPFLPTKSFFSLALKSHFPFFKEGVIPSSTIGALKDSTSLLNNPFSPLQDFSVSVHPTSLNVLNNLLGFLWLGGVLLVATFTFLCHLKLKRLKNSAQKSKNPSLNLVFDTCRLKLQLSTDITLYLSPYLHSPIAFGLFKPCIIIPSSLPSQLTEDQLCHIFLHELQHYKHKDIFTNYCICLFRILYWFQPFVWYILNQIQTDCEINCDQSVLKVLGKEKAKDYGRTLLFFAEKLSHFSLSSAIYMGGDKEQLKKRIIQIASFSGKEKVFSLKGLMVSCLMTLLLFLSAPLLSATNLPNNTYSFSEENVDYEDLSAYFENCEGSFVLYDAQANHYTVHNPKQSKKRISPNSTYKIYSGLIALETNKIDPNASLRPWDGTPYSFKQWNKNQDLDSAIKHSVNWYFHELDQEVGLPTLQNYLAQIGYGNQDLSGGLNHYWLESSLKISPFEQVELLYKLYSNSFDFQEKNIEAIKDSLLISRGKAGALYGKTGSGVVNNHAINGWFIGFIETQKGPYFFATNIQGQDGCNGSLASSITLSLLKDKELFPIID